MKELKKDTHEILKQQLGSCGDIKDKLTILELMVRNSSVGGGGQGGDPGGGG